MKKLILTTAAFALLSAGVMAQQKINPGTPVNLNLNQPAPAAIPNRGCGTQVPTQQWDEAFNKVVEQHKADMITGRTASTTYTIPVIFHIIHEGEAVGTGHNVSQAQVNSQIPVLNADYAGTGFNYTVYPTMTNTATGKPAFYEYAHATGTYSVSPNSLASDGSIAIANSGITFCLATKNPSGTTLTEPGIDRQLYTVGGNTIKPSATTSVSPNDINTIFDTKIKPATIWDPTKYFNVWVSDGGQSGLLGYATFPPLSASSTGVITSSQNGGASGNFGESNSGTPSNCDGVWVNYTGLGTTGAAASPYNKGRTLTHESGHWLGLRHIWGDGTCLNDYCNDTLPAASANYNTSFPNPKYPFHKGTCTSSPSNSTNGEMYMNFMDYVGDAEMWMFTTDQVNRFHAALTSSPYRSGLTASAANLCAGVTTTSVTAAFTYPATICANQAAQFTDGSSGPPASWAWSVNPSTGVVVTTSTSQNPTITFPAAGTYTVTLAATNTVNTNSVSHAITVTSCTTSTCDTVSNIGTSDTLTLYKATTGYFAGKNNYGFTGLAEAYAQTQFPTGMQVKGGIIIFYRKSATIGTHGTGAVTLSMVNGTTPGGTAAATKTFSLTSVASTAAVTHVDYAGNPALAYSTAILVPYVATFATPVTLNSDFFLSLSVPTATADTIALFSGRSNHNAANTAWVNYQSSWGDLNSLAGVNYSFAMIPIACPTTTTGIENNVLGSNINLFPNPNSGQFNFAISLSAATNLNFTVVNTLGQVVYTKTENNVSNTVLSCDLSHLAKGIYYANIVDSNNNKTVKKIIIE